MGYLFTRRFPCSVCGLDTSRHDGWFLVVENRWFDRIRILEWHGALAARQGFKSACGRQHLRVLLTYWLEHASLRLPPNTNDPMTLTSDSSGEDANFDAGTRMIGELSVFRDAFSRVWTGSPETLEAIVDNLIPTEPPGKSVTTVSRFLPPSERTTSRTLLPINVWQE